MKIELRKIHHSAQLSEETNAYTAQIWIDGKHVADVKNDGRGGCDFHYPVAPFTRADIEKVEARIKAEFPPVDMSKYGLDPHPASLESVCGDLLDTHLVEKDLKRLMRGKVLFLVDGEVRHVGLKGVRSLTPEQVEKGAASVLRKYPTAKILNTMPLAEAVAAFKKFAA